MGANPPTSRSRHCSVLVCVVLLPTHFGLFSAGTTYPGCSGVPDDWLPECPVAVYARVQIGGDKVFYWTPHTSYRWGNALSPYWQARALAELAGHGFNAYAGFDSSWLKYLPTELPAQRCPDLEQFNYACSTEACDSDSWEYAHRCTGAWQLIRPTIINDTHAAVAAWAAVTHYKLPRFEAGDTVIQSRCNRDTLLLHDEFGPVGFSYYSSIKPTARHIYIVRDPQVKLRTCAAIHAALVKWLQARYTNSTVQLIGGSLEHDFMQLLFAPVFYKDAQSSFGLWAGLANKGEVWSVPLLAKFNKNRKPDLGRHFHWVDSPVLYPEVAKAANISVYDTAAIIRWLESH